MIAGIMTAIGLLVLLWMFQPWRKTVEDVTDCVRTDDCDAGRAPSEGRAGSPSPAKESQMLTVMLGLGLLCAFLSVVLFVGGPSGGGARQREASAPRGEVPEGAPAVVKVFFPLITAFVPPGQGHPVAVVSRPRGGGDRALRAGAIRSRSITCSR